MPSLSQGFCAAAAAREDGAPPRALAVLHHLEGPQAGRVGEGALFVRQSRFVVTPPRVPPQTVLSDFQPDAETVFNTCCDLRKTFERTVAFYPEKRVLREDLTVRLLPRARLPPSPLLTPTPAAAGQDGAPAAGDAAEHAAVDDYSDEEQRVRCFDRPSVKPTTPKTVARDSSSYIAEMKFDGERFQLHRDGDRVWYWSKNSCDPPPFSPNIDAHAF